MAQGLEISGLLAWILLSLPYAFLAMAVFRVFRWREHVPARQPVSVDGRISARGRYGAPLGPKVAAPAGPSGVAPEMKRDEQVATGGVAASIKRAEVEGRDGDLAALYLTHARELLAAGRPVEAAVELRKSVRVASRIGNAKVHGEGRLELAELARAEGDLTTACEHWQIARRLFSELGLASDLQKADTLMRKHGCPTDWVLNDF